MEREENPDRPMAIKKIKNLRKKQERGNGIWQWLRRNEREGERKESEQKDKPVELVQILVEMGT